MTFHTKEARKKRFEDIKEVLKQRQEAARKRRQAVREASFKARRIQAVKVAREKAKIRAQAKIARFKARKLAPRAPIIPRSAKVGVKKIAKKKPQVQRLLIQQQAPRRRKRRRPARIQRDTDSGFGFDFGL